MIKKIPRKQFLIRYPDFPIANSYRNTFHFPETYDSYILYVEANSTIGLCKNVSVELSSLLRIMNYTQIFFQGDTTTPWLFREHDYKPVKQGSEYLMQHKISRSFNGAIAVDLTELPSFLKHLFWLVRCNGVIQTVHFCDVDFSVIISICQYGNVHFNTLNKETDLAFNNVISNTGLHILNETTCGGYAIPHRKATRV